VSRRRSKLSAVNNVLLVVPVLVILSGCSRVDFDQSLAKTNRLAAQFTQGQLVLAQTREQREEFQRIAGELLQNPLSQNDAVILALVNSPRLQALLARNWADAASAAQTARIANPVLTIERLRSVNEVELSSLLAFGLLDLLTLPQRHSRAQRLLERAQLQLTSDVVAQVTEVRRAWVKAVAAQQSLVYARQVNDAAQASAELARLLESVGNYSRLQRARQQAFYAEAVTAYATAQHLALAQKEALIRLLGLTDDQAQILALPERFPELPPAPLSPDAVGKTAGAARLDIQLAQADYAAAAMEQGLTTITSFTDIKLGLRHERVEDRAAGEKTTKRGFEVGVRLPLFDWGDAQRDAMNARTLAASSHFEATVRAAGSTLRQSYSAYRTAYDVARHYRDEVVPLRKAISEENLLRYNGMLISVFELLADSREQVKSVMSALAVEEQFWLSDAVLHASLIGQPSVAAVGFTPGGEDEPGDALH